MTTSPRFWNFIARKYARDPVADQPSYEYKLARTRSRLTSDMRLLEVGCGTGTTALMHAPLVAHVDATDFSTAMLDIARDKAARQGIENASFHAVPAEEVTLPETGPYDMVLAMSFLHLLPDPDAVMRRLHGLIRPGGFFLTSTTCADGVPRRALPVVRLLGRIGILPRLTLRSAEQWQADIARAGFEIEEVWRPGPGKAQFVAARKPGQAG